MILGNKDWKYIRWFIIDCSVGFDSTVLYYEH